MPEWQNQKRKDCPGCGVRGIVGFACVACYPRLPWDIRRGLAPQPGNSRFAAEKRQRFERLANEWFAANPRDVS